MTNLGSKAKNTGNKQKVVGFDCLRIWAQCSWCLFSLNSFLNTYKSQSIFNIYKKNWIDKNIKRTIAKISPFWNTKKTCVIGPGSMTQALEMHQNVKKMIFLTKILNFDEKIWSGWWRGCYLLASVDMLKQVNGKGRLDFDERQKEVPATDTHPTPTAASEARLRSTAASIAGIWKHLAAHHDAISLWSQTQHTLSHSELKVSNKTTVDSVFVLVWWFCFSNNALVWGSNLRLWAQNFFCF